MHIQFVTRQYKSTERFVMSAGQLTCQCDISFDRKLFNIECVTYNSTDHSLSTQVSFIVIIQINIFCKSATITTPHDTHLLATDLATQCFEQWRQGAKITPQTRELKDNRAEKREDISTHEYLSCSS